MHVYPGASRGCILEKTVYAVLPLRHFPYAKLPPPIAEFPPYTTTTFVTRPLNYPPREIRTKYFPLASSYAVIPFSNLRFCLRLDEPYNFTSQDTFNGGIE